MSSGTESQSNNGNDKENKVKCPFPFCNNMYPHGNSRSLKLHLRTIRGGGYDSIHPEGDPHWRQLEEFLKVVTRPKNVDPALKGLRRAAAQDRYYEKNKDRILEASRQRRLRVQSTLQVAKSFIRTSKERDNRLLITLEQRRELLGELYGSEDNYLLEAFVNIKDPPTIDTFPHLVTYFLLINQLPDILNVIPNSTRMLDAIPGSSHYRKASTQLHPDKDPEDRSIQSVLNAAFDLWRPILDDPELKDVLVLEHDMQSAAEFTCRGEKYGTLSQMYYCYMYAFNTSAAVLTPPTLCINGLRKQLASNRNEEELIKRGMEGDKDVVELIETVLPGGNEVGSIAQGAAPGGDVEENSGRKKGRKKKKQPDLFETRRDTTEDSSAMPPTGEGMDELALDPELHRTKRPRRGIRPTAYRC
jgi:hypothetical protein